ncbi:MAG TPA: hypothetical protein PLZ93_20525, partial [Nocardioides sp.]|nr:hypothetical protein [Nocardioides sp.]
MVGSFLGSAPAVTTTVGSIVTDVAGGRSLADRCSVVLRRGGAHGPEARRGGTKDPASVSWSLTPGRRRGAEVVTASGV